MNRVDTLSPEGRNPSVATELQAVEYPGGDGRPMAETQRHAAAMFHAWYALGCQFADREDVYVGIDMLLYHVEGNPRRSVAPDVFVAFGAPKLPPRDNWLVWREGKAPDVVLEVTSRRTRRRDEGPKRDLYRRLGVAEYWQYDPTGDYLDPRLKGARLTRGRYRPIPASVGPGGVRYVSRVLGLELRLVGDTLRFYDPSCAEYLATPEEERARADREAERADHEAGRADRESGSAKRERERAEAALRRVAELEAALREMR